MSTKTIEQLEAEITKLKRDLEVASARIVRLKTLVNSRNEVIREIRAAVNKINTGKEV